MARAYLEFLHDGNRGSDTEPSLFLSSRMNGTGKTHLAAAIGAKYIYDTAMSLYKVSKADQTWPCPVLFITAPRLFLRIRATYRDGSEETEGSIIDEISRVDLLILDDVGKEKPSDHTRQTYFTIIDARYGENKPMVITSNLIVPDDLSQLTLLMGQATVSRLKEMTEGWRVVLSGKDYRFRDAAGVTK